MGRRRPRPVSAAIGRIREEVAPPDPLAAIQMSWAEIAGESIAAAAQPASMKDGILRVRCTDSVWAEELNLMAPDLIDRLADRLGHSAPGQIRFFVGDVTD